MVCASFSSRFRKIYEFVLSRVHSRPGPPVARGRGLDKLASGNWWQLDQMTLQFFQPNDSCIL